MAEQFGKQQQIQRSIERSLENFKKLGRNNQTPAKIRSRIRALKELWAQLQDGHVALRRTIPVANQETFDYFKENHFERTEDVYLSTLDYMSECLEATEPSGNPDTSVEVGGRGHPGVQSRFSLSHLPPINLPPFDGSYDHWENFRDRFMTLILNNRELSDFARMHFLKSCLTGPAADYISGIPVNAENFRAAWTALTTRYENKRRLVNGHLSTLLNLPTITRESARELQLLRDKVSLSVASLQNLNRSAEELWSDILVHLVAQKLDPTTRKAWHVKTSDNTEPPSFDTLNRFLLTRTRALEEDRVPNSSEIKAVSKPMYNRKVIGANMTANSRFGCPMCNAKHFINACPRFLSRSPTQRSEVIRGAGRCLNCLSRNHTVATCPSKYSCRLCQQRHHSLLHVASDSSSSSGATNIAPSGTAEKQNSSGTVQTLLSSANKQSRPRVLLATAWVTVGTSEGRSVIVRALLDQGSEMTFVTENLAQLLHVKRIRMPSEITAIGGVSAGVYRHAAKILISPREPSNLVFATTALILKTLTNYAPDASSNVSVLERLSDLSWADPNPLSAEPISLIIGADLYHNLLLDGVRKGGIGEPGAQNSVLGWIISGPLDSSRVTSHLTSCQTRVSRSLLNENSLHHLEFSPLDEHLRQFWEVEEVPHRMILAPQDEQCDEHFRTTHSRDPDGRYIVRLPFKRGPPIEIGNSRDRAERMLKTLHKRLQSNPEYKAEYEQFLREYEHCDHMREVQNLLAEDNQCVYISHHPVIRESSKTTHLRVVFNASSATSNGSSLNDHLLTGPKLQTELPAVMLKWRQYRYVYTADIKQMYRQIRIDSRDINYQRILWNSDASANPKEYQLLTGTYGMASAPFLALRVLRQLVEDEGSDYPLAVSVLRDSIYVDDVLFGDSDVHRII